MAKFNETGDVIEVTENKQLTILKKPDDDFWHISPMLQNRSQPIERQIIIRKLGLEKFSQTLEKFFSSLESHGDHQNTSARHRRQISFEVEPMSFLLERKVSAKAGSEATMKLCPTGCATPSAYVTMDLVNDSLVQESFSVLTKGLACTRFKSYHSN